MTLYSPRTVRTVGEATVILLMVALPAEGQSFIEYTLQLDADQQKLADYVEAWEDTGFPPSGNPTYQPAAGLAGPVAQGEIITWDVAVHAGGSHGGIPGAWDSDGNNFSQINGVAAVDFSLELRQGTPGGPIVSVNPFFSAINDGDFNRFGTDPLEMAAFTHVGYHGDPNDYPGNPITGGPPLSGNGRLFDPVDEGGPNMDLVQYPSTADHAGGHRSASEGYVANPANPGFSDPELTGRLVGMQAAYSDFNFPINVAGIGIDIDGTGEPYPGTGLNADAGALGTYRGLAPRPVAEGQIDTNQLSHDTYCLVLVPGENNRIFRGDVSVDDGPVNPPFALPADEVYGDSVCFDGVYVDCFFTWQSVKEHGHGSADFPFQNVGITLDHTVDFAVPPDPAVTSVEPRRFDAPGRELKDFVVVSFCDDITANGYVANQAQITSVPGNGSVTGQVNIVSESVGGAGNELLILELEIVGETQNFEAYCVTIDLADSFPTLHLDLDCKFRIQYGNTAGGTPQDRNTNLIDFAETKGLNGANVVDFSHPDYDPTLALHDWNLDGNVNLIDAGEVKSRNGKSSIFSGCPNQAPRE